MYMGIDYANDKDKLSFMLGRRCGKSQSVYNSLGFNSPTITDINVPLTLSWEQQKSPEDILNDIGSFVNMLSKKTYAGPPKCFTDWTLTPIERKEIKRLEPIRENISKFMKYPLKNVLYAGCVDGWDNWLVKYKKFFIFKRQKILQIKRVPQFCPALFNTFDNKK